MLKHENNTLHSPLSSPLITDQSSPVKNKFGVRLNSQARLLQEIR
jgi:hypothetical protein